MALMEFSDKKNIGILIKIYHFILNTKLIYKYDSDILNQFF